MNKKLPNHESDGAPPPVSRAVDATPIGRRIAQCVSGTAILGTVKPLNPEPTTGANNAPVVADIRRENNGPMTAAHVSTASGKVRSAQTLNCMDHTPEREHEASVGTHSTNAGSATARTPLDPAAARGVAGGIILVIEDDLAVCKVLQAMLETQGHNSLFAQNGRSGLMIYQEHRTKIAVVITDMTMQGMQGPEVIRELRLINPDVRIIAMSGFFSKRIEIVEEFNRLVFLPKPMSLRELNDAMERVMPVPTK